VGAGRFALHDLLRDYAAERAAELPPARRAEAQRRMFDHYVHSSLAAWRVISNVTAEQAGGLPVRGALVVAPADYDAAQEWFAGEIRVLLSVVPQAEAAGADEAVWRLALSLHLPLLFSGDLREAEAVEQRGLLAAQRLGDGWAEARLHRCLAATRIGLRALPKAVSHLEAALRYESEFGPLPEESNLLRGLSFVHELQGRRQDALRVLEEFQPKAAGLRGSVEEANYLSALGFAQHKVGEHEQALKACSRATELFAQFPDQMPTEARATAFETLGAIHFELGRHAEAIDSYREAIGLLRQMKSVKDLAVVFVNLAKVHVAAGDVGSARGHLVEAESIYLQLSRPELADVRELLSSLD